MKTTGNTILITGGTAGIGLEMARLFSQGNKVIITGRDEARLKDALSRLPGVTGIQSDVSDGGQTTALVKQLQADFPDLNMVINNAGKAFVYDISTPGAVYKNANQEMETNFLSVVRLNDLLMASLKNKNEAAIVNVSSIVAFAGSTNLVTYAASKAALHSYTQLLRIALADTGVRVFELMPPLVNTEFSKEIGGANGIAPELVALHLLDGLSADTFEIRSGNTEDLYRAYLASPEEAFRIMNQGRQVAKA